MEIQVTDLENAAFSVFIVLITRAILSFDLNFYIPIAKVSENMETAHARDAVLEKKFYFRKNPFTSRATRPNSRNGHTPNTGSPISRPASPFGPVEDEYELMSVDDIINGSEDGFPGLIPLVESYLDSVNVDVDTLCELATYLNLIKNRANGTLWTAAKWIREYVREHPEYKGDSVVGDGINHDLIGAVIKLGCGEGTKGVKNVERFLGKRFGCG